LTEKFEKYLYSGDLTTLTAEDIDQFVSDIKDGKIEAHKSAAEESPEEPQVI